MFDFFSMAGNYEDRKVGRTEYPWGFISTCYVSDGSKDYETAVQSEHYSKDGGMVIVESYDTAEEAKAGHAKWCDIMENRPPKKLVDCYNAGVAQLLKAAGGDASKKRITKKRVKE